MAFAGDMREMSIDGAIIISKEIAKAPKLIAIIYQPFSSMGTSDR